MKKQKMYVNKISKKINNNQDYCNVNDTKLNDNIIITNDSNNTSVLEKLENLFNMSGYVFNKNVKIVTNDKTYETHIAGKINDYIITLDNDIIEISSIKDIVF